MRSSPFSLLPAALVALGGCQSLESPPATPQAALAVAEQQMQENRFELALATLQHFGPARLAARDKAQWYLLAGTAQFRAGDPWEAFQLIRDHGREHGVSKPEALGDLTFQIGETLAASGDWSIFHSDRTRARTVLSDFVVLYPTSEHMPDALHRLGEMAYEDGDYDLARERFTKIMTGSYRNEVWNTKAGFRVAMCFFLRLEGPAYDLEEMQKAMAELTHFLESDVENPRFRAEAQAALRTVRDWLGEKHLSIATFYRRVGNARGCRHHLQIATTEFPETPAAKQASEQLGELDRRAPGAAAATEVASGVSR